MTDLVPYQAPSVHPAWVDVLHPVAELAKTIANTSFVPDEFRNKPAEITACILYGHALGLDPMVSLSKIDVVKGKPRPKAELGRALALNAGHELWFDPAEVSNSRFTWYGRRRGSDHVMSATFTMDDAKRAGIAGNPSYSKYPRAMLSARASTALVRDMCPECLGGITVFAEEADDVRDDPSPVAADVVAPKATRRRRSTPVTPEAEVEQPPPLITGAVAPAQVGTVLVDGSRVEVDSRTLDRPSEAQTKMAMASFNEVGISERDDRLAATSAFVGRPVTSWSDLNRDEASTVIDGLEHLKAGTITFAIDADGWTVVHSADPELDLEAG